MESSWAKHVPSGPTTPHHGIGHQVFNTCSLEPHSSHRTFQLASTYFCKECLRVRLIQCGLSSVWSETTLEESKPCLLITRYWFKLKWKPFIWEEKNRNRFFKMITEYFCLRLDSPLLIYIFSWLLQWLSSVTCWLLISLVGYRRSSSIVDGLSQSLHYISLETGERRCVSFFL